MPSLHMISSKLTLEKKIFVMLFQGCLNTTILHILTLMVNLNFHDKKIEVIRRLALKEMLRKGHSAGAHKKNAKYSNRDLKKDPIYLKNNVVNHTHY